MRGHDRRVDERGAAPRADRLSIVARSVERPAEEKRGRTADRFVGRWIRGEHGLKRGDRGGIVGRREPFEAARAFEADRRSRVDEPNGELPRERAVDDFARIEGAAVVVDLGRGTAARADVHFAQHLGDRVAA